MVPWSCEVVPRACGVVPRACVNGIDRCNRKSFPARERKHIRLPWVIPSAAVGDFRRLLWREGAVR